MNLIPWRNKHVDRVDGGTEGAVTRLRNEMDQLFDQFIRDPWGSMIRGLGEGPAVDVCESDNDVVVSMEVPGVDPKDVDIDVSGATLTVRGEKKQEHEEKDRSYYFSERTFGRFQRTIQLPGSVDPDKVEAVCRNGTLRITLGKRPDAQRRRIEVRNG
jgi:HSP20 family protein